MLTLDPERDRRRPEAAHDRQRELRHVADDPLALRCRGCRVVITHPDSLFPMRHTSAVQVFPNPAGIVHEILTARYATGLILWGEPTREFTWFTGYAWQVASCARCGAHLGWRYSATDGTEPTIFYGLLRQRLTE